MFLFDAIQLVNKLQKIVAQYTAFFCSTSISIMFITKANGVYTILEQLRAISQSPLMA